ncbi:hypothetical protein TNCV_3848821 [Trichonephila clavipes]|uniref:Uncharacterized protein n=1 Tax=Trichonephila clavipes TaxID=2585209 RepID=A0A8X6RD23_TRICX|nr:hypothetical protein TNCV_3848821 [Trichonephila clavipes]
MTGSVAGSPRVVEQCDVNIQSITIYNIDRNMIQSGLTCTLAFRLQDPSPPMDKRKSVGLDFFVKDSALGSSAMRYFQWVSNPFSVDIKYKSRNALASLNDLKEALFQHV